MYVFKKIEKSDIIVEENSLYTKQALITSSLGLTSIQYRSGSFHSGSYSNKTVAGSHWDFLRYTYYLSGSSTVNSDEVSTFNSPFYSGLYLNAYYPQHRNKFHSSGSVMYIPHHYIGETIDRGSFIFTDLSYSSSIDNTIKPIIKDDGYGNLYSSNAYVSQSSATSVSSSDNYVGNIIYEDGVIMLTETGSWSGSVNYTDLSTQNYSIEFAAVHTIFTKKIMIKIRPEEFNTTLNPTARSGSINDSYALMSTSNGRFNPYITRIEFYNEPNATAEPLMVANLSKIVEKIDDTHFIIEVEIDF